MRGWIETNDRLQKEELPLEVFLYLMGTWMRKTGKEPDGKLPVPKNINVDYFGYWKVPSISEMLKDVIKWEIIEEALFHEALSEWPFTKQILEDFKRNITTAKECQDILFEVF